ncbi:hypothetical protein HYC85_029857, partial [Camellia sinensis]
TGTVSTVNSSDHPTKKASQEKTDEEETEEEEEIEEEEEEEPDEQQDNDKAEERQQTKGDQQEDLDEEKDQQQEQQTNQQEEVNEQELTNQQEELQEKSDIFHAQGHDQPQTPTKEDDKDKLISAMRAQMQEMEQKFMAELRKKEDQLKEMSTKKTGSPQQRSMVKRIKQKSRKQAHDPDFEYQPMTKPKEDVRNKTQTAADVPKPTQGTDEEKEKKNDNKKEGAHEAKQQQKEKMQEHIRQEKAVAAETNPKEHANQKKTKLQVLESDDDFQEESIPNKPLAISCRKTNKVIDAFSEKQLALQPTIEEFEKNDLVFASNPYAGRSYVFSTLINQQHQLRWNKALLSKQGNMLSSQECKTEIASIEECPQQTPHSNDCAIAVCNVINQYLNWQPVQKKLRPTEWVKFRAQIINQFLIDENRSWKLEHYQMLTKHTKP